MTKTLALAGLLGISLNSYAQDTTTFLQGRRLQITQNSTDSVPVLVKNGTTAAFSVTSPIDKTTRNPYVVIGAATNDKLASAPSLSIGTSWYYSGAIDPSKAKLILHGSAATENLIGMSVSDTRGLEFFKGKSPGFHFDGRLSVANSGLSAATQLYDSAVFIGRYWPFATKGTLPYLLVDGGAYSGNGDATKAKLRIFGSQSADIIGLGVSSKSGIGVEYFSGLTGYHTFYGHVNTTSNIYASGKMFQKDTIYFGASTTVDRIGAGYLSLGKSQSGAVEAPAKIEMNYSYSNEVNKPLKSKLQLYGATDVDIIGFGITSGAGLEVFTGHPQMVTFHGFPKYDVNRASQFDARTLVDKGYVDSVVGAPVTGMWNGSAATTSEVYRAGGVGIGGVPSTIAGDKLAVHGTIRARRIVVTSQPWADYVFDSAYMLKPLKEVWGHIQQFKRLPGMPSAEQIEKEGLDAADIIRQQQEKIEELTLYVIAQEKKQQEIETQLAEQARLIKILVKKMK